MAKYSWLLVLSLIFQSQVFAKETIVWLAPHPQHLAGLGEDKPMSIGVDTDNLLLKALPQYQIEKQIIPIERLVRLLNSDQSYCIPNRIKNKQRAEVNLFSIPMKLYPGLKLYWQADNPNFSTIQLNDRFSSIRLSDVFGLFSKAILGVTGGRSYGDLLDQQIQALPKHNLFIRHGEYHFSLLVKMFNSGKFDFVIEFPTEMNSILEFIDRPHELRSIALTGIESYQVGHIACSKTEKNRRYIFEVNQALRRLHRSEEYYQAHTRYLPPTDWPVFKQHYQKVFD